MSEPILRPSEALLSASASVTIPDVTRGEINDLSISTAAKDKCTFIFSRSAGRKRGYAVP